MNFDIDKMLAQVSEVSGASPDKVKQIVFDTGLQTEYESGRIDCREFHEMFCAALGSRPDFEALRQAASDIFELNTSVAPIVMQLRAAGHRLGILSNTCHSHWEHCRRRYPSVIELFDVQALSYRLRAVKPNADIFVAAAELAGVDPREIFFVDDTLGHVQGARASGFDAVQYTSTPQLAADLRARDVAFNY
ncbi:MAG: HAD family phosphatase [Planctomycetota bacterium]|nr:HAD family phosphatase [Planctomycetota bacterium]